MRWVTSETIEEDRRKIEVWYKGKVTTIGEMEDNLCGYEVNRLQPMTDNKLKNMQVLQKHLYLLLDYSWRRKFLSTLDGWDRGYWKSRQVK